MLRLCLLPKALDASLAIALMGISLVPDSWL
jgi:hypothetical protein